MYCSVTLFAPVFSTVVRDRLVGIQYSPTHRGQLTSVTSLSDQEFTYIYPILSFYLNTELFESAGRRTVRIIIQD